MTLPKLGLGQELNIHKRINKKWLMNLSKMLTTPNN